IVWNTAGKDVADGNLESNREDIEACKYIFGRRFGPAGTGNAAQITCIQIDEVEDSFLIELIRIVELAGDDPSTIRQSVDVLINECLLEKADCTTRGIPGVITFEGTETVDESIRLRPVVIWQNRKFL